MLNKVRVGNARCMCHGHYVRRGKHGNLTSEFGIHDGNRTYIEKTPLKKGDVLYKKAKALFRLHDESLSVEEQKKILKEYGFYFMTFTHGIIKSGHIGRTTVDGHIVGPDEGVYHHGDFCCKSD